jgi:hypothetical protein
LQRGKVTHHHDLGQRGGQGLQLLRQGLFHALADVLGVLARADHQQRRTRHQQRQAGCGQQPADKGKVCPKMAQPSHSVQVLQQRGLVKVNVIAVVGRAGGHEPQRGLVAHYVNVKDTTPKASHTLA